MNRSPFHLAAVAVVLVLAAGFARSTPPPQATCCVCVATVHPESGEIIYSCSCTHLLGGLACQISASGCFVRGSCNEM